MASPTPDLEKEQGPVELKLPLQMFRFCSGVTTALKRNTRNLSRAARLVKCGGTHNPEAQGCQPQTPRVSYANPCIAEGMKGTSQKWTGLVRCTSWKPSSTDTTRVTSKPNITLLRPAVEVSCRRQTAGSHNHKYLKGGQISVIATQNVCICADAEKYNHHVVFSKVVWALRLSCAICCFCPCVVYVL